MNDHKPFPLTHKVRCSGLGTNVSWSGIRLCLGTAKTNRLPLLVSQIKIQARLLVLKFLAPFLPSPNPKLMPH